MFITDEEMRFIEGKGPDPQGSRSSKAERRAKRKQKSRAPSSRHAYSPSLITREEMAFQSGEGPMPNSAPKRAATVSAPVGGGGASAAASAPVGGGGASAAASAPVGGGGAAPPAKTIASNAPVEGGKSPSFFSGIKNPHVRRLAKGGAIGAVAGLGAGILGADGFGEGVSSTLIGGAIGGIGAVGVGAAIDWGNDYYDQIDKEGLSANKKGGSKRGAKTRSARARAAKPPAPTTPPAKNPLRAATRFFKNNGGNTNKFGGRALGAIGLASAAFIGAKMSQD